MQKDRSDGLFDGMRFLVRAPKSQYRQVNSADDGLFLEANALNSLGKAAFQQAEFWLTVFLSRKSVDFLEMEVALLTATALKHLKYKAKDYKVTDRDGMCVLVKSSGALTFRYDYRMNGLRETVTLGQIRAGRHNTRPRDGAVSRRAPHGG